ncbi:MAG: protein phosphatase CheZ [Desulfovibrio sp.]|jgi:chemotaxis protein CheZ|nr:protein phosphatase CheZ [Desulfovibrio sp.]
MIMTPEQQLDQMTRELLDGLVGDLTEAIAPTVIEAVTNALRSELNTKLSRALMDGELYRRLNDDMQSGLKDIYAEIKTAKGGSGVVPQIVAETSPEELFNKASDQLDAVLQTTEKAAVEIIEIVEQLQEMQGVVDKIVKGFESGGVTRHDRERLKEINTSLGNDLSQIMVTMSFQDLTGQRIKIIIDSLKKIEQIVQHLIVSTGLMIQTRAEAPDKNLEEIEQEVKSRTTSLSGPSMEADQQNVDDLLSQFGL